MIVVEHRPPLKRIDFGPKPPAPWHDPENPTLRDMRVQRERLEFERIWRCVERASQGQGSVE